MPRSTGKALVDVVFNGMYTPTAQAVSAASPFYIASVPPPARDLAKAKALIKQSGVPTPIMVHMNVPNTPDRAQVAEVIQSMVQGGRIRGEDQSDRVRRLVAGGDARANSRLISSAGRAAPIPTATCSRS